MNIYQKLNEARKRFHELELKKSGHNKFAGYLYFELGDFLIPALGLFEAIGITAIVSFEPATATMTLVNTDKPEDRIVITSPMGSAALKGCHEVQNIGAVETYQRRYLWCAALEVVEHDAINAGVAKPKRSPGKDAGGAISATAMAYDSLTPDWQQWIDDLATRVENTFDQQGATAAQSLIDSTAEAEQLDPSHITALWSKLSSKTRSTLKASK